MEKQIFWLTKQKEIKKREWIKLGLSVASEGGSEVDSVAPWKSQSPQKTKASILLACLSCIQICTSVLVTHLSIIELIN